MDALVKAQDVVLFQGDSITCADRDRPSRTDLGSGYAFLVAALYGARYPEHEVAFLNRGNGGNRAVDLRQRWEADCLEIRPSVVSILVGINEVYRKYERDQPTDTDDYRGCLTELLCLTRERLNARFILLEPFLLPISERQLAWRADLEQKIQAVREVARKFEARLVPLDDLFARAARMTSPSYWTTDGIHPTPSGHGLIARAWLQTAGVTA